MGGLLLHAENCKVCSGNWGSTSRDEARWERDVFRAGPADQVRNGFNLGIKDLKVFSVICSKQIFCSARVLSEKGDDKHLKFTTQNFLRFLIFHRNSLHKKPKNQSQSPNMHKL